MSTTPTLFDKHPIRPQPAGGNGHNGEAPSVNPPLKWAGGKRWLLPHLQPLWSKHRQRRLVEPFCGGLAVTLGLLPRHALLNDVNPHLINFYRQIKHGLQLTIDAGNDRETFDKNRDRFNGLIQEGEERSNEAAQLFYYLNRTGYNGLCRFNRRGLFNVPFGRHSNINYVRDFEKYRGVFKGWVFKSRDFQRLTIGANDFIYADPPYDVEFTKYSAAGFTWDDQVRLVEWLARQDVPVVLSNQATDRIVELYSKRKYGFRWEFFAAPRRISCTGDRTAAREILAVKNV